MRSPRREIVDAYDVKLLASQSINGRLCWGLDATPRPDFRGKGRRADQIKKLKGKAWIDQASYELVKLELTSLDTISFGTPEGVTIPHHDATSKPG